MPIMKSSVFSEDAALGIELKDKDLLAEAFVYVELASMNAKDKRTFASSPAAKYLIENEIISSETLERLTESQYGDRAKEFFVCNAAKENDDPQWKALVEARAEERRILDTLFKRYGDEATAKVESFRETYINHNIPKSLRNE